MTEHEAAQIRAYTNGGATLAELLQDPLCSPEAMSASLPPAIEARLHELQGVRWDDLHPERRAALQKTRERITYDRTRLAACSWAELQRTACAPTRDGEGWKFSVEGSEKSGLHRLASEFITGRCALAELLERINSSSDREATRRFFETQIYHTIGRLCVAASKLDRDGRQPSADVGTRYAGGQIQAHHLAKHQGE